MLARALAEGWGREKRFLVTGGNRGLGRGIAARLLALGVDVIVTSRSQDDALPAQLEAEATRLKWPSEHGSVSIDTAAIGRASVISLDLADLANVQRAVDVLAAQSQTAPLDGVILNAGLAPPAGNETTVQGFELALGVNAIGHYYLLTRLQRAGLLLRPTDRVVVVTSETFRVAPPLELETLFAPVYRTLFNSMDYYARSKLVVNTLNTHIAQEAAAAGRGPLVHLLCPGPVVSDISRSAPSWAQPVVNAFINMLFQSPDQASWPVGEKKRREGCGEGGNKGEGKYAMRNQYTTLSYPHLLTFPRSSCWRWIRGLGSRRRRTTTCTTPRCSVPM